MNEHTYVMKVHVPRDTKIGNPRQYMQKIFKEVERDFKVINVSRAHTMFASNNLVFEITYTLSEAAELQREPKLTTFFNEMASIFRDNKMTLTNFGHPSPQFRNFRVNNHVFVSRNYEF